MEISYNKLWKLLIDKGMNRTDLRIKTGISSYSLAKLGKGEKVTNVVLRKICKYFKCEVTDIMDTVEIKR